MSIRFSKYINITSGVGAGVVVANRDLIGRLFTTNPLLPTDSYLEFTTAAAVGAYFGLTSQEYYRASYYFRWISKNITSPQKISFGRWTNAAVAPMIFGGKTTDTLSQWELITNGSFTLTMGGFAFLISGLNFSSAGSFAAIATILQTAIQAETGGGALWTGATVTYDATLGGFDLVGGTTGDVVVSVAMGTTGTDISAIMGWLPRSVLGSPGAIWSNGNAIETITETLTNSVALSNNFGSFLFMPSLDLSQIVEAATWNTTQNVTYMYMVPVDDLTDATTYADSIVGFEGVAVTLVPTTQPAQQYPEQMPMMILAATNYDGRNSVQNYMYQQIPGIEPGVTDDATATALDALGVNYFGQTQQAGQFLTFYQYGILMGASLTQPPWMNLYANEMWLRDAAGVALITLLLTLTEISANTQGRAQILSILQPVIDQALRSGVISVGGVLNQTQILYINEVTGDDTAWYQVQGIGYWVDCVIRPVPNTNPIQYQAVYTLVYKKDDVINSINGTHILI